MFRNYYLLGVIRAVLLLIQGSVISHSQTNAHLQRIPNERGLSNKVIPAILQDKEGYMWFATQEGLNRYDGYQFKVYQRNPGTKNSLSSDNIFCAFRDKKGTIWLGTEGGGLTRFNPEKNVFTQYKNDPNNPKSICSNELNCIKEAPDGKLWLGSWNNGISIFDPKTGQSIQLQHDSKNTNSLANAGIWDVHFVDNQYALISLWGQGIDKVDLTTLEVTHYNFQNGSNRGPSNPISGIFHQDKSKRIWFTSWGGCLNYFNPKTETFEQYVPDELKSQNVRAWPIVEDANGKLWIGVYEHGVYEFDPDTKKFIQRSWHTEDKWSLSHNDVWSLYFDKDQNLWMGTEGGGINLLPAAKKNIQSVSTHPIHGKGISTPSVRNICEDPDGKVWIATWNGTLDCYDPILETFTNYTSPTPETNKIRCVFADKKGVIWSGSYRKGLGKLMRNGKKASKFEFESHDPSNPKSISHNYVLDIHIDNNKRFWVATAHGLNIYHPESKTFDRIYHDSTDQFSIPDNTVNVVFEDSQGDIYIGTDLGLCKFLGKGKFLTIAPKKHFASTSIYSITEDKNGILWLATKNGLISWNKKESFKLLTQKDGLPANFVKSVAYHNGNLWLGTINGISKYTIQTKTFVNYNQSDGLANYYYMPNAVFVSKNGTIYFGGSEGLDFFKASEINDNQANIPIYLTSFVVENDASEITEIDLSAKTIELNYDQNIFSLSFIGLNYDRSDKNQYAYKLEGINNRWVYSGAQRTARYSGLPPGTYTFLVKACNNDGLWTKDFLKLTIVIYPPFWETWWFRISVLIILIISIVGFFRYRIRAIRIRNQVLENTVKERTKEVVRQKEEIEEQHKEIKDSINYAKRLQNAILPPLKKVHNSFPDSFILFKPKDIVSGDFYWMEEIDGLAFIAAADCTGHGVPGAMVSVVCSNALNRSLKEFGLRDPGKILDKVTDLVIEYFSQSADAVKDGMDIALCCYDPKERTLQYAGANNPLWLIQKHTDDMTSPNHEIFNDHILIEFKANKQPIGVYADRVPFTTQDIPFHSGDRVYLFSDGMADQFGGDKGKKMKSKPLKEFLLGLNVTKMEEQEHVIFSHFEKWKSHFEQVDDICMIGIRM